MKRTLSIVLALCMLLVAVPLGAVFASASNDELPTTTVTAANHAHGVLVTWGAVEGAEKYEVSRAVYENGEWSNWAAVKTTTNKVYLDKDAASGSDYKYQVKAVNSLGQSSYSTCGEFKYLAKVAPTVSNASLGVKISWAEVEGADEYQVRRKVLNNGKWTSFKTFTTATGTSVTDMAVEAGKSYYYIVCAKNGEILGEYGMSEKITATNNGAALGDDDASAFTTVPYTSKSLKYVGRWEETDGAIASRWNYSSVEISFTGSKLIAEVDSAPAMSNSALTYSRVLVTVDGGAETSMSATNGLITLDLGEGEHTVKIAGNVNYEVTLKNIYVAGTVKAPVDKTNILFIGDSISHYTSCYSFQVGNLLGWDWSVVAQAGMALQDAQGYYPLPEGATTRVGMETCFFKNESAAYTTNLTDADFKYTSTPDVVVIYLGTNDTRSKADSVDTFVSTYVEFVGNIREMYPDCKVYVMESVSSDADRRASVTEFARAAYTALDEAYDNVSIINSYEWDIEGQADGTHPTAAGSAVFAQKVAEVIAADYGITLK